MSLRAIWIIPAKIEAEIPVFLRHFPSVEARCKSRMGLLYVKIPPHKDFIKMLFKEIGILDRDVFVRERDQCSKLVSYPVVQLPTEHGVLWPLVVLLKGEFIYCALPFEENLELVCSNQVHLSTMSNISMAIEVLNGLENFLESKHHSLQGSSTVSELIEYVTSSLPFGRPVSNNPQVAQSMCLSTLKGKGKQPAWNPEQHKGKSYVTICIREEVRSIQFNSSETADNMGVYGVVQCSSEVEGLAPEISLVLTHSFENNFGLIVNTSVSNVEHITPLSSRLRFHPLKSQNLCYYKISSICDPPLLGQFSMKITGDIADVHVSLHLQKNIKNLFQRLEVQIPFPDLIAVSRPHYSQGSVENSNNIMIWNVGSKFPSKTLDATLKAKVKLKKKGKMAGDTGFKESSAAFDSTLSSGEEDFSPDRCISYAQVMFVILDYTYSGCKIDAQSVVASSVSKLQRSVSSNFTSGVYKIWNSESNKCMDSSISCEEIRRFLT